MFSIPVRLQGVSMGGPLGRDKSVILQRSGSCSISCNTMCWRARSCSTMHRLIQASIAQYHTYGMGWAVVTCGNNVHHVSWSLAITDATTVVLLLAINAAGHWERNWQQQQQQQQYFYPRVEFQLHGETKWARVLQYTHRHCVVGYR